MGKDFEKYDGGPRKAQNADILATSEGQREYFRDVIHFYNTVRNQRDLLNLTSKKGEMLFISNDQFKSYQGVVRGYRAIKKKLKLYTSKDYIVSEAEIADLKERKIRMEKFFEKTQDSFSEKSKVVSVENLNASAVHAKPEELASVVSDGEVMQSVQSPDSVINVVSNEVGEAEPIAPGEEKVASETITSPIGVDDVIDAEILSGENSEQREFSPGDSVFYTTKGGIQTKVTIIKKVGDFFRIEWKEGETGKTSLANESELSFEITPSSVDSVELNLEDRLVKPQGVPGGVLSSLLKKARSEGVNPATREGAIPDPDAATSNERAEAVKNVIDKFNTTNSEFSIHSKGLVWYQVHMSHTLPFAEVFTYLQDNPNLVDTRFKDKIFFVVKSQIRFQIETSKLYQLLKNDGFDIVEAEGRVDSLEIVGKQIGLMQRRFNKSTPDEQQEALRVFSDLQSEMNEKKKKSSSERFEWAKSFMAKQREKFTPPQYLRGVSPGMK